MYDPEKPVTSPVKVRFFVAFPIVDRIPVPVTLFEKVKVFVP
jgi:hypothetical protein